MIDNHELFKKIVEEGLYHVTTKESADKILESGVLNLSNVLLSLGIPKVFFFCCEA